MEHLTEYLGLAGAAFLSATVFPFQSEVILFGMLMAEHYQVWLLVLAASLGNILGSCVNWFLGRFIAHFEGQRWFPVTREQVAKAEGWYHRYGRWSLLLSRMPIIGDPLTIVAGVLREPFPCSSPWSCPLSRGHRAHAGVDVATGLIGGRQSCIPHR
ncbi:YqaA family protein [Microvirga tunisiensis]|uniref:YqaA family protein n=1 Tax=Microvirga tunisiensis TaxID=2108360 RepID=UPI001FCED314|nr:YqaA family protein [Microvirga tunisiensis]